MIAELEYETSIPWVHTTEYANTNLTEASPLWQNIDFDTGTVALPNSLGIEHGLPEAQPFPWDPSQGIYLLNGYHSLHCLVC